MASGAQVGTAWVSIVPSFQGFASSIQSDLTGELVKGGRTAGDKGGDAAGESFASSFSDRASSLTDSLSGVGTVAGGVVAGAFAVGLASAMDTSTANAKLTAQLGLTEAEAARVGGVAGDVFSAGFGGSIDDVNAAVGAVASSIDDLGSITDAELNDMTTAALGLADVFQWDVGEASQAAGQLIKNGLAKDGQEAFDLLAAGAKELPAQMQAELPSVIGEYSANFSQLGLDGEQMFGMISSAAEAGGWSIDQAADAVRELGIRVVNNEAPDALTALGFSADDMAAKFAAGGDVAAGATEDLWQALVDLEDPQQQAELGAELFGSMWEDSGSKAILAMNPATAALEDAAGASSDLSDALAESPAQQMEGAFRTLSSTLGELLLPALTTVASFASNHPTLFKIIAGVILVLAVAFSVLTVAVWASNIAMLANPITWIILAIVALIAIIILVVVYFDEIVAAVVTAWDWIKNATQVAWDWLVATFAALWDGIVAGVQAAWDWIMGAIGAAWDWIVNLFMTYHPVGIIISHWDSIKAASKAAWDWVKDKISAIWNGIISTVTAVGNRVWSFVTGIWGRIKNATSTAFTSVRNAITNALNKAYNTVRNIGSRFATIGKNIVQGIIRGVTNAASGLYGKLKGMATGALNAAKSVLGISSPSRVFAAEVGAMLPAGIEVGIDAGQDALNRRVNHMVHTPAAPAVRASLPAATAMQPRTAVLEFDPTGADRAFIEFLQKAFRTKQISVGGA